MISREVADEFGEIVGKALRERFKDDFVFDPIVVEPLIDPWGDAYLDVFIIFDGDQKKLDSSWNVGLSRRLGGDLDRLGVPSVPSFSFVEKSEWQEVFHGKHPRRDDDPWRFD